MIPNTFLSIDKNNKLKILFVQGKFNMGGTGPQQTVRARDYVGLCDQALRIRHERLPQPVMTKAHGVSHDTVPYFMERFRDAYTNQLQNFARNVLQERPAPVTIDDGMEARRIGVAATQARESGVSVTVADVTAS